MNNVVSTVIKFLVTGQNAAVSAIQGVSKASGVATRSMATLATSLGSMGGSLGKAASQAANFMASIQQMGAIGGIIAGAQIAITAISDHFIKKANEMAEAVGNMATKVRSNLDKIGNWKMDRVSKALDEATVKAKEASSAFDALASSYLKVQAAQNATAKSGSDAAVSGLALEKARAMSGASDDGSRALVGADYDIRIARAKGEAVRAEQDRSVKAARDEAGIRGDEATAAEETVLKAKEAQNKAYGQLGEFEVAGLSENDRLVRAARSAAKEADRAYEEAVNNSIRKRAEADAASERVIQAENARRIAINDATRGIVEAEDAEKRLVAAQTAAAQAELERLKAEGQTPHPSSLIPHPSSLITHSSADYASQFQQAFDLWRDPEAAAAAVESDKKRSADLKEFNKEVNRYGGKYKIDEYAALMRAGDEEGMQAKLDEWRKSSKFTPQAEQLVKAEAARQNENAADRALANIEKNTSKLADKLDQLLQVK